MTTVMIASYFEEEYVRRVRELDDRARVLYREELVPPPRWDGDHSGPKDWSRSPEQEEAYLAMLAEAEVLLDFPPGHVRDLTDAAPRLRWVQGSMAGAGSVAREAGLLDTDVAVTTASGVFSGSLAEFALGAMLHHAKDFDRLRRDQQARRWDERQVGTLQDKTLCIVGMGSIGRTIAERARPFGLKITGVKRTVHEDDVAWDFADDLRETSDLREALAGADYVAATLPHTPETEWLLNAEALASMKPGAYFINVGRGQVVDEAALAEALAEDRLSGAALDVFEQEPLPEESPLWDLENVIVSPHSTDNVPGLANGLLTDLFCENLQRYLKGEALTNVLDKKLLY